MLKTPAKHEFPVGNVKSQAEWLNVIKTNGCFACHALGNKATRTIPAMFADMKPEDAWARRILSGQAMNSMATAIGRVDTQRALKLFADWTDRIAAGELPAAKPQRPQGRERNVVITQWDFSDPKHYLHDITATDKRKPTLNANGLIYGAVENSTDLIPVLDPVNHRASTFTMPVRDPKTHTSRTTRCRRRRTGATRRSGTARPARTTRCTTRRARSGSPRGSARRRTRTSARRAPTIRRPRCSRWRPRRGIWRCTIPRPARSR